MIADADADAGGDEQGGGCQLDGPGQAVEDLLHDRHIGLQRAPQVTAQGSAHIAEVLDVQRAIQAHVFAHFFQQLGTAALIAEEDFGWVAGCEMQHEEDGDRPPG